MPYVYPRFPNRVAGSIVAVAGEVVMVVTVSGQAVLTIDFVVGDISTPVLTFKHRMGPMAVMMTRRVG
jgi:hypothetical protein